MLSSRRHGIRNFRIRVLLYGISVPIGHEFSVKYFQNFFFGAQWVLNSWRYCNFCHRHNSVCQREQTPPRRWPFWILLFFLVFFTMKLFRRSLLDRSFSTTTLRTMTVSYQMLILMNIVREHLWKKCLFRLVGTGRSPCWQLHWWKRALEDGPWLQFQFSTFLLCSVCFWKLISSMFIHEP